MKPITNDDIAKLFESAQPDIHPKGEDPIKLTEREHEEYSMTGQVNIWWDDGTVSIVMGLERRNEILSILNQEDQ